MKFLKVILFSLNIITILSSCNNEQPINTKNIFEKALPTDSLSYYFPPSMNDTFKRKHSMYQDYGQKWFRATLYAFKEPILYNKIDSQSIYRLLWSRAFHPTICFSIKHSNGNYFLNAKTLDREPEVFPTIQVRDKVKGKEILDTIPADRFALIATDTIIMLKKKQGEKIDDYLSKLNFWNSPNADPEDQHTTDGSTWIIEGRKNNKYHYIERRNAEGDLMVLGKYFIKLSGLKIREDAIY